MKKIIILCLLFIATHSYSNGITVSSVNFNSSTNQLSFTLTWENSWTFWAGEPDLYDAAWIWIKYAPNGGDSWFHTEILDSVPVTSVVQYISYDDLGIMVYKSTAGNETFGPQQFTVELAPLTGNYQDFKVFATEMVFIDNGDFYAGDGLAPGRFYQDGNTSTPWLIDSEDAITRGNGSGEFHQEGSTSTQNINANFPKGYNSFYCMKYKITAQQYMDFLNCLTRTQQNTRTQADLSGVTASNKYVMTNTATVQDRNPIACDVNIGTGAIEFYLDLDATNPGNSANDGANVVLNHLTPADIIAYLDWSGMRPMTELEFEKINRGKDVLPIANEFAWGTDTRNAAGAITNDGTATEATANVGVDPALFTTTPLRAGYAATSSSGRTESCGTFWGVMDMHNLGEYMYGVESLNFSKLSYGDGTLDAFGNAIVPGWTVGAQLLCTQDPSSPNIEPISQGKNIITPVTRSAYMGARGIRKLIIE
jgi:formylglycine-generating enzyme required for sulfatase activity